MKTVSIVIPNWNGRAKLEKNLPQVVNTLGVAEIIIVDDASNDDSVAFIKENYPKIRVIEKQKNEGFSSTVNVGVSAASSELIFLLNSDAYPYADCVNRAIAHFDNPKVFSVDCFNGRMWAWAKFKKGYFWHGAASLEKDSDSHQTLWACGGNGIFRKSIWKELSGMDELFNPFYEEDIDLGYRATKRGYINIWEPQAQVEHYKQKGVIAENFSPKRIQKIAQRNQLFFIWKNITSTKYIISHIMRLPFVVLRHPTYLFVLLSALQYLPLVLKRRVNEKKEAKLTDEEILAKYSLD